MARHRVHSEGRRLVWRMDALNPAGAYIDTAAQASAPAKAAGAPKQGWQESSLALNDGLQVSETPMDSLPDELIDELLNGRR